MIIDFTQRSERRKTRFIPPDNRFNPLAYEVAEIRGDTVARAFVEEHHYSATYPAARVRFGLYKASELVGVAVYSHPTNDRVLARLPCERLEGVELGRFVLLDAVPFNAETWFIARCHALLHRAGYRGVVSFSDPEPRLDAGGVRVFRGHLGMIYQASNAVFVGRATPRTLRLRSDGTVMSARTIQKIRARERGWRYAAGQLERDGASPLGEHDDARAWVAMWLPRITRKLRHPGNLTYLFGLDGAIKRLLPPSQPYPRIHVAEAA